MSKHERYPKRRFRQEAADALSDSNEQELEKIGPTEQKEEEHISAAEKSSPIRNIRRPKPIGNIKKGMMEISGLPVRKESMPPIEVQEEHDPSESVPEKKEPPKSATEEKQERIPKTKRERPDSERSAGVLFCIFLLTLTLLAAVGACVYAFAASRRYQNTPQETEPPADLPAAVTDSDKVVFVRPFDENSGLLTAPELYGACADSVVSVVASDGSSSGIGSGFVLSSDGYIATANHVVENRETLEVVLAEGDRYPARLINGNELTDLALLKIEATGLSPVSFGSSAELLTGERVLAIGTPASLEYAGSMCSGEVSYGARTVFVYDDSTGALQKKLKLIQTDAPVNPGNSGCPLFNEYGQVVGMITMKLGDRYAGIGFAIPADGAKEILFAMMEGRELTDELLAAVGTTAPKLGLLGEAAEVDGVHGVKVNGFSSETASVAAVLRTGDLITRIDETLILSSSDIGRAINQKAPRDTVAVTVLRGGQYLTYSICLEK